MLAGRWTRLERYARWRSGRLALESLGDDLLGAVAAHLDGPDLLRLVEAMLGAAPRVDVPAHVASVPEPLRALWLEHVIVAAFETHVYALAERALFHARDALGVMLLADWSPFVPPDAEAASPVAEYAWAYEPALASRVRCHRLRLLSVVRDCLARAMPAVRLALHTHFRWGDGVVVHPHAVAQHVYYVLPLTVV